MLKCIVTTKFQDSKTFMSISVTGLGYPYFHTLLLKLKGLTAAILFILKLRSYLSDEIIANLLFLDVDTLQANK